MVKTTEQFIEDARKVHGNKYNYDKVKYKNNKTKIIITCPEHGDFLQTPNKHLIGRGCPKCCNEQKHFHGLKTKDQFIEEANKVHNNFYDYSKTEYYNNKTKIEIICPIHGSFWQTPNAHLRGQGCMECGRIKTTNSLHQTQEEFISKAKIIHNDRYDYSKVNYVCSTDKVIIVCKEHGEFLQSPANHLQGQGCPKCIMKNQSRIYEFLKTTFPNLKWEWEASPSWLYPQRFDIYNEKYNLAVEYNGQQHYIPVEKFGGIVRFEEYIKQDQLKQQKCKENNCNLYIIKFDKEDLQDLTNYINNIINNY